MAQSPVLSRGWYRVLRYKVVPPLFIVLFTGAVQWLGLLGSAPCPLDTEQCPRLAGDRFSWTTVAIYLAWVVVWLRVPAPQFIGPESPEGERPSYQDNGFSFYLATVAAYLLTQVMWPSLSHEVVARLPEILAVLSLVALVLCLWLLAKARLKGVPSSYPVVYDFYRGCELHPRVLGCDAKQLAVSRVGMMLWQLLSLAACLESRWDAADLATLLMQTVYIAKFFWWECGYFTTLDVTYDRAGYYLCWGGMVWIPALFPLSQLHLARHPSSMSEPGAVFTTALCLAAIALEYDIDHQKEHFVAWRMQLSKGEVKPYLVWGKAVSYVPVTYTTVRGETRRSALLTGGYWGLARHANYTCELACALLFGLPSAVGHGKLLPLLYFYFIAVLIPHRILRDEDKCRAKYGEGWSRYCSAVPYRFIPYIF